MKATMRYGERDIRFEDRPDPSILAPSDAIVRLSATCVCGSDLWPYRGISAPAGPSPMGHEHCGIVEEVGRDVTSIMPDWDDDELGRIASRDDLHVAPFREDGVTYGTPTWIWSVVVDGDLYVRAYNGRESWWYAAAMRQRACRRMSSPRAADPRSRGET